MGLSGAEVNAVTASWDTVKDNWNPSLGAAFLMKLFTTYPNIRKTFPYGALSDAEIQNNDKFKGHVVNFKAAIQGLVDGLKDEGTLKKNIDKLADDHIKRNVTDMTDFINAFNLLAAFLVENGASGGDAWKKALSDVSAALAAAFKSKGK